LVRQNIAGFPDRSPQRGTCGPALR